MAEDIAKSERMVYAYAKKYNWLERAKEYDSKHYKMRMNLEKLKREELKINKIEALNKAQDEATNIINNITNKNHLGCNLTMTAIITQKSEIDGRLNSYNKILRAIECYTKICISIDTHLDKIMSGEEDDNLTEKALLDLDEHYKYELENLNNYVSSIETKNIWQEFDMIGNIKLNEENYVLAPPDVTTDDNLVIKNLEKEEIKEEIFV